MDSSQLLADAYGRIRNCVNNVLKDITPEQLEYRANGEANSIAWLVWHLTRIQDDHLAHLAEREQVWTSGGWQQRFGLPFEPAATGYGHSSEEVGQVKGISGQLLLEYYDAVHQTSLEYIGGLSEADFDRVVDTRFDPPVTLGARLVSVLSDNIQHGGQAALIKGMAA